MIKGFYGELEITAIDRKGNRYTYSTPNKITLEASVAASHLLVGDQVASFKVSRLGVGTSAVAPVRTDGALGNIVHQQLVTEISFPAPGQVLFLTVIDFLSSANGYTLKEAGLFCENGTSLFARQVHTDTPKDDNFKLEYNWRIVFT